VTSGHRWLVFGLKAVVSAALIVFVLHQVNISEAAERAQSLSLATALLVIAILCAYIVVAALRWHVILRVIGSEPTLSDTVRVTFIGVFFNQILPATVGGDAVRVWECYRCGMGVAPAIHSVILDRACYLVFLALFAAFGVSLWGWDRLPAGLTLALWAIFAGTLALLFILTALDRFPSRLLPGSFRQAPERLAGDSRAVLSAPGAMGAVLLLALANQGLLIAAVLVLSLGLGTPLAWSDCLALIPAIVLISSLPISVAGWGVREYAMVTAFGFAGVPPTTSLVTSISLALFTVLASLPGALLWFTNRRRFPR
jgi:glycosyltransferase 2 family protein